MNRVTITVAGAPPTEKTWRQHRDDKGREAEARWWVETIVNSAGGRGTALRYVRPAALVRVYSPRPPRRDSLSETIGRWAADAVRLIGYRIEGDVLPVDSKPAGVAQTMIEVMDIATKTWGDEALEYLRVLEGHIRKAERRIDDANPARQTLEPGGALRTDPGDLLGFLDEARRDLGCLVRSPDVHLDPDRWVSEVRVTAARLVVGAP